GAVEPELGESGEARTAEDARDRLAIARSEWEGLPQDPDADIHAKLAARFQEACDRAKSRHENRQESAKSTARLEELGGATAQLAAQEDSPAYAWDAVAKEWQTLRDRVDAVDEAVAQKYSAAETTVRERA